MAQTSTGPSFHPLSMQLGRAQWLRLAAIIVLPAMVWGLFTAIYDRVPQQAGNLAFDIVINHLTSEACIDFHDQAVPPSLREFSCQSN